MMRLIGFALLAFVLTVPVMAEDEDSPPVEPPADVPDTPDTPETESETEKTPPILSGVDFSVRIDRVTVKLPGLTGFVPVRKAQPGVLAGLARSVPPDHEALDALLPAEVLERGRGVAIRMHMIRTKRAAMRMTIDAEEFLDLRVAIRKELGAALESAETTREIKVGQSKILEIFDETDDSISVLVVTRVRQARRKVRTFYQAASTCLLNGKVLYLTTTSKAGDADRDWVKHTNKAWVRKAIELNAVAKVD